MTKKIITLGGATEDITFYPREAVVLDNKQDILRQKILGFEYGAKVPIEDFYSTFGGGAANTAINFSRLGFKASIITCLGKDERAEQIKDNLKKQKVDTSLMLTSAKDRSPFSLLLIGPRSEHVAFVYRGAKEDVKLSPQAKKKIQASDWLYVTSLSGTWQLILKQAFNLATKIAWNPGSVQLKKGIKALGPLLEKTTVLCVNKDEAIELVLSDKKYKNKEFTFFDRLDNLLQAIKDMGPKIVVITDGKRGASAFDGQTIYKQPIAKEKKRVDTTGVGDSFNSSFIAGLELYQGNIKKALSLGAKSSASVIGELGAQNGLLTKKSI